MRGSTAKKIRRKAEQITVGMENVQYQDVALNEKKPTRRTRRMYNCTRLVYQTLKKNYKAI